MKSTYRTYLSEAARDAVRAGLFAVLKDEERADIIRISVRTLNRRTLLLALIGVPGKMVGRTFELAFKGDINKTLPATWTEYGLELGRAVEPWLAPAIQEPLQAEAAKLNRSAWDSHEIEDVAEDAVAFWEDEWRPHLGGKIHPKAKAALIQSFVTEMMKVIRSKARTVKKTDKANGDS